MFEKRVVIDSNVYISALVFGGIPREILQAAEDGKYSLMISEPIRAEVERVMEVKFSWPRNKIQRACQKVWKIAEFVKPERKLKIVKRDPSDDKVLECAADSYAHFIVTGDDDLLSFNHFQDIEIVNPKNFLDYLKLRGKQSE